MKAKIRKPWVCKKHCIVYHWRQLVNILLFQIFLCIFISKKEKASSDKRIICSTKRVARGLDRISALHQSALSLILQAQCQQWPLQCRVCSLTSSRKKSDFPHRSDPYVSTKRAGNSENAQENSPELFLPENADTVRSCGHYREQRVASLCAAWVMRPR